MQAQRIGMIWNVRGWATTDRLLATALLVGLMLCLAPTTAITYPPATFTVNTTADTDDAYKGNGICADSSGNCSLRAAISEANALAGADTITLPAGTYTLTRTGDSENANATGDLDITSNITLNGAGAGGTIIDGNQLDRVLSVLGSATASISGVTLRNGKTPDVFGYHGGGVYNSGTLTLSNSVAFESLYAIWDGGGADNNTSTAANWSGNAIPGSSVSPVFCNRSSKNASVNGALSVAGWIISGGYGGTVSQGSSNLTVNGNWEQSGGTFSGGSGALDLNGAFNLSNGAFTAPTGLMSISGVFNHTGGAFNPNTTGCVLLGSTAN